ncbi:exodeoxyribonuclease VII large subunit [Sphaerotilaceae bacterium SBD11-9]
MSGTFLIVDFSQNSTVKALGAKWDASARKWYVPPGLDLAPFHTWLPAELRTSEGGVAATASSSASVPSTTPAQGNLPAQRRGKSLSQLLASVKDAVARAFRGGEWTIVDVVQATMKSHVYLELAERDSNGVVLAKANAVIWASVATEILPKFEAATGISIGPGIKLLVRARPDFSAQYGFKIVIDAVDPDFTLGELEAHKREIRTRLKQAGLWGENKKLAFPWDFNDVLVLAPEDAAGLGDFRAEARRLEAAGICRFTYAYSRFQGPGAAEEITAEAANALAAWRASHPREPDALVFIRGGGAVNDLAWLNHYDLARFVCEVKIPVLTGIGHERDSTILDEVAHTSYDTPSKVIAGVEATIIKRVREAQAMFDETTAFGRARLEAVRRTIEAANAAVQSGASQKLSFARVSTAQAIADVRVQATRSLGIGSERSLDLLRTVQAQASTQLAIARQRSPLLLTQIRDQADNRLQSVKVQTHQNLRAVVDRSRVDAGRMRRDIDNTLSHLADDARQRVASSRNSADALLREVAGQGPQKTLARGFAHVRSAGGETIMSAHQVGDGARINVTFHDGVLPAEVRSKENES